MKASQKNENNKNYYQADVTHTHIHTVPYVSTHNTCIGREESASYEMINVSQLVTVDRRKINLFFEKLLLT